MTSYLAHHGVKGQKWGVRRYQNPDGSLTALGRERIVRAHGELSEGTPHLGHEPWTLSGKMASRKIDRWRYSEYLHQQDLQKAEARKNLPPETRNEDLDRAYDNYSNPESPSNTYSNFMAEVARVSGADSLVVGRSESSINVKYDDHFRMHIAAKESTYRALDEIRNTANNDPEVAAAREKWLKARGGSFDEYRDISKKTEDALKAANARYQAYESMTDQEEDYIAGQLLNDMGFRDDKNSRRKMINMVFL